jgi:hypothetical protein
MPTPYNFADREQFRLAEARYQILRGQFDAHVITARQFDVGMKQLMVQDAAGRYWAIGGCESFYALPVVASNRAPIPSTNGGVARVAFQVC